MTVHAPTPHHDRSVLVALRNRQTTRNVIVPALVTSESCHQVHTVPSYDEGRVSTAHEPTWRRLYGTRTGSLRARWDSGGASTTESVGTEGRNEMRGTSSRRRVACVCNLTIALAALGACGGSDDSSGKVVTQPVNVLETENALAGPDLEVAAIDYVRTYNDELDMGLSANDDYDVFQVTESDGLL